MFTEEYYREKMQLAIRQAEFAGSSNDKKFYEMLAQRWAALLPEGRIVAALTDAAQVQREPAPVTRDQNPIDTAQRLGETRNAWRLRADLQASHRNGGGAK